MKLKRILILTLTFIFLVSTVGLPVTYHLCQMMQKTTVTACGMCENKMESSDTNCSSEKINDNFLVIKSEKSSCCSEEFVFNKVDDEFVFTKSNVDNYSASEIIIQPIFISLSSDNLVEASYYNDSSPPFLINPDLYLTNSTLLI